MKIAFFFSVSVVLCIVLSISLSFSLTENRLTRCSRLESAFKVLFEKFMVFESEDNA